MDLSALILSFVSQYPIVSLIAHILGALVVLGQAVVALTPSASDDAAYQKIMGIPLLGPLLQALASFAPIQKK